MPPRGRDAVKLTPESKSLLLRYLFTWYAKSLSRLMASRAGLLEGSFLVC